MLTDPLVRALDDRYRRACVTTDSQQWDVCWIMREDQGSLRLCWFVDGILHSDGVVRNRVKTIQHLGGK